MLLVSVLFLLGLEERGANSIGGSDIRGGRSKIRLPGGLGHHSQSLASDGPAAFASQGKPIVGMVPLSDRGGILEKGGGERVLMGCILEAIVDL